MALWAAACCSRFSSLVTHTPRLLFSSPYFICCMFCLAILSFTPSYTAVVVWDKAHMQGGGEAERVGGGFWPRRPSPPPPLPRVAHVQDRLLLRRESQQGMYRRVQCNVGVAAAVVFVGPRPMHTPPPLPRAAPQRDRLVCSPHAHGAAVSAGPGCPLLRGHVLARAGVGTWLPGTRQVQCGVHMPTPPPLPPLPHPHPPHRMVGLVPTALNFFIFLAAFSMFQITSETEN